MSYIKHGDLVTLEIKKTIKDEPVMLLPKDSKIHHASVNGVEYMVGKHAPFSHEGDWIFWNRNIAGFALSSGDVVKIRLKKELNKKDDIQVHQKQEILSDNVVKTHRSHRWELDIVDIDREITMLAKTVEFPTIVNGRHGKYPDKDAWVCHEAMHGKAGIVVWFYDTINPASFYAISKWLKDGGKRSGCIRMFDGIFNTVRRYIVDGIAPKAINLNLIDYTVSDIGLFRVEFYIDRFKIAEDAGVVEFFDKGYEDDLD